VSSDVTLQFVNGRRRFEGRNAFISGLEQYQNSPKDSVMSQ
jgi:hypothetical protein